MEPLKTVSHSSWNNCFSESKQKAMTKALENGQVLFFPQLDYELIEQESKLFSLPFSNLKSKNISFNKITGEIRGLQSELSSEQNTLLFNFFTRFADVAHHFITDLFPHYCKKMVVGRTSFRPSEIEGRVSSSYRKDDTRLHVDAFPAHPVQGNRILRVFCNINPQGQPRIWRLGESFADVAKQFLSRLSKPLPGMASLYHFLTITKKYRTLYDHYMLQLHNAMKADLKYQKQAKQIEVAFPANSTWVVQTDHVSHAAMAGQYVLEQTFYLPVDGMLDEEKSPLRVLEKLLDRPLVSL